MNPLTEENFTPIVGIPNYVHHCLRPVIIRKHIELRAVRESRCDLLPEESFAAVIGTIYNKKYKYIEVPETVGNAYYANCALLHEIGHLCTKNIFWMPTYQREVKAWKHAERIAKKIGFNQRDPITGMSWDEAKECSLSTYKAGRLKKSDFVTLLQSILIRYVLTVLTICLVILGVIWFTGAKSNPDWLTNFGWWSDFKEIVATSSFISVFKTFKHEKKNSFLRFAQRWNSPC